MAESDSIGAGAIHALAIAQAATHVTFIRIMVRRLGISPVEIRHELQATRENLPRDVDPAARRVVDLLLAATIKLMDQQSDLTTSPDEERAHFRLVRDRSDPEDPDDEAE